MTTIPDIEGKDVAPGPSPTEQATTLAAQIEAENTARLQKLAAFGMDPQSFELAAIQLRLEALIDTLSAPHRALVEVGFETSIAAMLDEALAEVAAPKLHVPSGSGR